MNESWNFLFLELDGTLITPRDPKHKYVRGVSDIYLRDCTYEILKYHKNRGAMVYVLTNQPLVAMGERTLDDVYALLYATNYLLGESIDGFGICPHHPDGVVSKYAKVCDCRKPGTALYREFMKGRGVTLEEMKNAMLVSHDSRDATIARGYGMEYKTPDAFFSFIRV